MVAIRLKQEDIYEALELKFEHAEMVLLVMENSEQKEDLLALILGRRIGLGNCEIKDSSVLTDIKQYKKKVDYIHPKQIDSDLSVEKYLLFFAMVANVYQTDTLHQMKEMFQQFQMEENREKAVNTLSRQEKILVRCMAAALKNVELLIADHILQKKKETENRRLLSFLEEQFVNKGCVCILLEEDEIAVREYVDEVIIV